MTHNYGLGDPDGMRALAASLRAHAETVGRIASKLDAGVDRMKFDGPYATTVRARLNAKRRLAEAAQDQLYELAGAIVREAGQVEAEIERRRLEELRRQEEERRRREEEARRKAAKP